MPDLALHGLGVITDTHPDVRSFAHACGTPLPAALPFDLLDDATAAALDPIASLALRALHQAWTMARMTPNLAHDTALLFVSAWGTIDSTVAYLDSMLDADGKFASPRHFSRSVYSAVASLAAIQFNIKGPCETLAFRHDPVTAALRQAHRLLALRRADRVAIVWAEQSAPIAQDLARRAVGHLHKKEYARYLAPLGHGAVALLLSRPDDGGIATLTIGDATARSAPPHPPFASDAALDFAASLLPNISSA